MSKKMTPCEKLGYKVGDEFEVISHHAFKKGQVVTLHEDDGTECPLFAGDGGGAGAFYGVECSFATLNKQVRKIANKLKPAKQSLADAIHQNGGWRSGANWACQHGLNRMVVFSASGLAPTRNAARGMACWNSGAIFFGGFQFDRKLPNWHQCVLSRDEYYHAYPKADADGWIEHDGKHEPAVATSGLTLWCRWSDGLEQSHEANMVDWIDDSDVRIIAYRLHNPEVKPEFCESVTRSIPEPELDDAESRLAKALEFVKAAAPRLLSDKYKFNGDEVMGERKPTIEQLAQDYRSAKGYAYRKQQEADAAKDGADAKLAELVAAGKALGLVLSVAEPELVTTKFTGKFHSAKYGDRPSDLDMICDGCGKRFGHHVGFDCRP